MPLAKPVPVAKVDDKEQRKRDADDRLRLANLRKPIETRIKRLEEQMAKLNIKKKDIDVLLEDGDIYNDANKEKLKALLLDQAYVVKELGQIEADWLEQQEFLGSGRIRQRGTYSAPCFWDEDYTQSHGSTW